MSSRRNFLDADNSIMEKNLRFVKNDLEENLNQYFGGSAGRGNSTTNVTVPPRDYKVVQPKPVGSHAQGLESRKGFLLKLGLARHEAYELAKFTNFDVDRYEEKCQRWLSKGYSQEDVFNDILCDIRSESNWNENATYNQGIASTLPSATVTSKNYGESYKFDQDNRDCNIPGSHQSRSRFNSRNDHEMYYGNASRSRSPNKKFDPKEDNYDMNDFNNKRSNSRPYSSSSYYNQEELTYPSRTSRSPERRNEKHFSHSSSSYYNKEELTYPSRNSRSPEKRNEKYFSNDNFREGSWNDRMIRKRSSSFSPSRHDRRIQHYHTSTSRSPERSCHTRKSLNNSYEDLVRIDSEPNRTKRYQSTRSRSPNRNEGFLLNLDYSSDLVRRENPRSFSPSKNERSQQDFQKSRSRSPNSRNFLHRDHKYGETFKERSRSRAYSPPRKDLRHNRNYQSSRSRSPNRTYECIESSSSSYLQDDYRIDRINYNSPRNQMSSSSNNTIPSLLDLNVYPNQSQTSNEQPQSSKIPSLLSLKIDPKEIGLNPSTRHDNKLSRKPTHKDYKKPTTFQNKGKFQQNQMNSNKNTNKDLKQHISNIPVIKCGLQKPPPGHLKANPQEYWTQWWPKYKYIEYSLPKIDPNDNEIKNCLHFLFRSRDADSRRRKQLLLKKGVNAIMKTVDINEHNYYLRDIFKLFQYKKHLEDPSFQNSLTAEELNCIAPALRQFQIKSTMAYLHQAMIVKWHVSLDIMKKVQAGEKLMSNYARLLLNEKSFHYLVKESIQELKQMCQRDWPQFNDFYKKLKANKVDIYSLGVGPNFKINSNRDNFIYRNEGDHQYHDDY